MPGSIRMPALSIQALCLLAASSAIPAVLPGQVLDRTGPDPAAPGPGYSTGIAGEIVERFPEDARAHFLLARAQQRGGLHERALEAFRRGLDLAPGRGDAWESVGDSLAQMGRPRQALEAFRRALAAGGASDPDWVRVKIGGELHALGLLEEAEEMLRSALEGREKGSGERAAGSPPAGGGAGEERGPSPEGSGRYLLAQVLIARGRPAEAAAELRRALEHGEPARAVQYSLARALRLAGDAAGAERAMESFRRERDREDARQRDLALKEREERRLACRNSALVHFEAAELFLERGLAAEALGHLGTALEIDADLGEARFARARLSESRGDLDAAVGDYEELLRRKPDLRALDSFRRGVASACRRLARELLSPPRVSPRTVPEALRLARLAVDLEPDAPGHEVLAWALIASKRRGEGMAALGEAVRLDPENSEYRRMLEALRRQEGE